MAFKTKKSLGQHFLIDNNIIYKIISSINAGTADRIIEIGPGTGALTKHLANKFKNVHVIELDARAVEILKQDIPDITIHQKDVLKVDWNELTDSNHSNYVIGNLPYYITSPILFSILASRTKFKEAILMMQKEVAERLVAKPNNKQYGILSVQTQLMSTPEILFDVSPNSFNPPPKVMSSVIRLKFDKPKGAYSDKMLKNIVRTAFNQRRKKLSNALKPILKDYKPEGYNLDERAENWAPEIYAKLAELLEQNDI